MTQRFCIWLSLLTANCQCGLLKQYNNIELMMINIVVEDFTVLHEQWINVVLRVIISPESLGIGDVHYVSNYQAVQRLGLQDSTVDVRQNALSVEHNIPMDTPVAVAKAVLATRTALLHLLHAFRP
ncbi:hypothetical protein B0H10DRAFT_1939286 [Mycena sp. CBHHK59/15]|nr:hypothetical protein B0H10DRAFT_1939286 [Mycena sp. CBHHK59/15]